jgi:phosphoribosyl 1,2-cyclic phosphodiesterase
MTEPFRLAVEFWGVRGSTPTPEAGKLGYGGNTTCISVHSASGHRIVIDAGTGIRKLGRKLLAETTSPLEVNLFLTHFHWDHIQGLPFFSPLLRLSSQIHFYSGLPPTETRDRLHQQMMDPFFTLDFAAVKAKCTFSQVSAAVNCGDLTVRAFPLNHPQRAWGYRIECEGAVVVVATDLEHGHAELDHVLREHAAHADLLIYDAQYTDAEYADRVGWGHSTPRAAVAVAAEAEVKRLVLFHHDPNHDDAKMNEIGSDTRLEFPNTSVAQEDATILL